MYKALFLWSILLLIESRKNEKFLIYEDGIFICRIEIDIFAF